MRIRFFFVLVACLLPSVLAAQLQSDDDPVPYPVPVGYDRCIVVVFSEAEQERTGKSGKITQPPINSIDANGLNAAWDSGLLKSVNHCTPRET